MSGAPEIALRELCRFVNGKAFKPTDWSTDGHPIIRIQNLNKHSNGFNYWAGDLSRQILIFPGDLLLAWSGTPGTSFGAHVWNGPVGVLNQHIFRVELDEAKINRDYCLFAINSRLDELISKAHGGVGLQHFTKGVIQQLKIPLPPLDEQRRIVDLLERAAGIRRLREQALAKARAIVPALFLDMFGDPATNPKRWPVCKLGDVCYLHGGSTLPTALPFTGGAGGTLVVKVGDLNTPENSVEIVQSREWVPVELTGEQVCPAGAVVFPKRGAAIATNKKRITGRRAALDPNLMGVSPRGTNLLVEFLHTWFDLFDLSSIQSGTTVPQLNKKDLVPLAIAVPPLSTQDNFADRLVDLRSIIAQQERSLAAARELERSLMARLLG